MMTPFRSHTVPFSSRPRRSVSGLTSFFVVLGVAAFFCHPLRAAATPAMNMSIVNNSGYADDRVYFIVVGQAPLGYLDFSNHVFVATPSFTLDTATMTATLAQIREYSGDGTCTIPFPALGSIRIYFALGQNFDQMGGFPSSGPSATSANPVPFGKFEGFLGADRNVNSTEVDFFSIAYTLTATRNTGESVTVGITNASSIVFGEFESIPSPADSTQRYGNSDIFKACIVRDTTGAVVRVLAPKTAGYADVNSPASRPQMFTHFMDDYVNTHCWKPQRTFSFSSKLSSDSSTYYGRVSADGLTLSIYTDAAMTTPYANVPTLPRPSNAWGTPDFATYPSLWHNVGVASTDPSAIDWGYLLYGQDGYASGPGAYWISDPVAMTIPASIDRGVMHLDNGTVDWKDHSKYYQGTNGVGTSEFPIYHYAKILHQNGVAGHVYALSYDDIYGEDPSIHFNDPAVTLTLYPFRSSPPTVRSSGDYDGDGKADLMIYRAGLWYALLSTVGYQPGQAVGPFALGGTSLIPTAGDFDGDGRNDPAAYDPSTGVWQIRLSLQGYAITNHYQFGTGGSECASVEGDFDGDHQTDLAVYVAASGVWQIRFSASQQLVSGTFGGAGYEAMAADFDGDGKADPTLYHTETSLWRVLLSSTGYAQEASVTFGAPGCRPFAKDFDGDGQPDLALYHEASGRWGVVLSSQHYAVGSAHIVSFPGVAGYTALADDFDGDRKTDLGLIAPDGKGWFRLSLYGYTPNVGPLTFNPFAN